MLKACTQRYTDASDERRFCFTFFCDVCGAAFQSTPILCSIAADAKRSTELEAKLYKFRWQNEHARAFARANQEASIYFFACPGCGRSACPRCVVSEMTPAKDIWDRCPECAARSHTEKPFRMTAPRGDGFNHTRKEVADASPRGKFPARADKTVHG